MTCQFIIVYVFVYLMKNFVKSATIWAWFAFMPLNINANNFGSSQKEVKQGVKSELFENFNNSKSSDIILQWDLENINLESVDPKLVVDATLDYFKEEVRAYKLSPEAKKRLVWALNSYLVAHPILKIWSEWEMIFVIDNKKAFSQLVKQFASIVIDDMPFLVRKVAIPLFFGWVDGIQRSLDNLDSTVMNLKEKQYKDVIFDYIWWIVKRVVISLNWNMKVGDYYNDISGYYPNKNSWKILWEMNELWLDELDMKDLKYPFKK